MLTTTAHSVGKIVVERLGEGEAENEGERGVAGGFKEISIPFMNENLAVVGISEDGVETVNALSFFHLRAVLICSTGACNCSRLDILVGCFNW